MVRGIARWTPELERSFKELLFRFLEEVQSTKAALYLFGQEGTYLLAVQYGFGRQDLVAAEHHASDPLARKAREEPKRPVMFNSLEEFPEAASYIRDGNTSRLLLVPLQAGSRVVGFVDLRDKGRKRPFEQQDLERADSIGKAILRLVRQVALYPDVEEGGLTDLGEAAAPVPVAPAAVTVSDQPETIEQVPRGAVAPVDERGLEEIIDATGELLRLPGVATAAVSVVNQGEAGTVIFTGRSNEEPNREALLRHQVESMRLARIASPELTSWRVDTRRIANGQEVVGALHVASSVLLLAPSWALLGSVLVQAGSTTGTAALDRLKRTANRAAEANTLRRAQRKAARRLLERGEKSYPELVSHSLAVSRLCWSVAAVLGGSPADMEDAAMAGLLHDVGMYEVDYRTVYRHPSPGAEERRLYQQHATAGATTVAEIMLDKVVLAIRHHHERWDGKGYPSRLARDAIPPLARLVHAAEVFDTLTAKHSYRQPVPPAQALAIMRAAAGQQFDPDVVEALAGAVG